MENIAPNGQLENYYCNLKTHTHTHSVHWLCGHAGLVKLLCRDRVYCLHHCVCDIQIVHIHTEITLQSGFIDPKHSFIVAAVP